MKVQLCCVPTEGGQMVRIKPTPKSRTLTMGVGHLRVASDIGGGASRQ